MAVTRIKAYHSSRSTGHGLRYIADENKTRLSSEGNPGQDAPLQSALSYAVNPVKTLLHEETGDQLLVFGHNCIPDNAAAIFANMKARYLRASHTEKSTWARSRRPMRAALDESGRPLRDEKGELIYDEKAPIYHDPDTGKTVYQSYMKRKDPRDSYMLMISFPGAKELGYELDPRIVESIGKAFMEEYLDGYAAVWSIHLNTDHPHIHAIFSAYPIDPVHGHKYKDNMTTLSHAREISDTLSVKFGLPVIVSPGMDQSVTWYEWEQKNKGQSWKEEIRRDIRQAIELSSSKEEFVTVMKNAGYTIRETAHHFTFSKEGQGGTSRRCRDVRLNSSDDPLDYSKDGIRRAVENHRKELDGIAANADRTRRPQPLPRQADITIPVFRYTIDGRKRLALEIIFIQALKVLTLLLDRFQVKNPPNDHPIYQPADKKIGQMEEALQLVQEYGIEDKVALEKLLNRTGIELSMLKKEVSYEQTLSEEMSEVIHRIDEALDKMKLLPVMGLSQEELHLYQYSDRETRRGRAALMPMTSELRRELYLELSDSPIYRLRCKYEELTLSEAREILDYLHGRTTEKPAMLYDKSDPFTKGYLPKETDEIIQKRKAAHEEQDDLFRQALDGLSFDDQMEIDHLRTLLNQLQEAGIRPDALEQEKLRLMASMQQASEKEQQMEEFSRRYRNLKKLSAAVSLAETPEYTHGPLYQEKDSREIRVDISGSEKAAASPGSPDKRSVPR